MHEALLPMLRDGVELLYTDTDSALLKVHKDRVLENDLPFGNSYREVRYNSVLFYHSFSNICLIVFF